MESDEKMEIVTKEALLQAPPVDYHALDPELIGCCPCCPCCGCCDCCGCCSLPDCRCDSCPGCSCGSCPGCGCCPGCCCPPSCGCCCRLCCSLPKLLCRLPQLPSCPVHLRRVLIIVMVVVVVVVIIVAVLLMGVFIVQAHTETVLRMTIDGLEGEKSQLNFPMEEMEEVATFHVEDRISGPAMVIYDFSKLLIGYKPWQGDACYIARMNKENIQGLDMILKEFQTKSSITPLTPRGEEKQEQEAAFLSSLVDRSSLGSTINILCSHVPIFWA
ncbi:pulmonary surfactant-associated protein C-like [Elgaria multicarinata webbii]|uniref:pulmonary surfactant-associated protein C-like n=1 Tax=Elgaria multicarinata webbii TaxID=159646 RepID=UPI002FCD5D6F